MAERELTEFLGSWENKKQATFIYGREFHLTKGVVTKAVKEALTKIETKIFKTSLTFQGF